MSWHWWFLMGLIAPTVTYVYSLGRRHGFSKGYVEGETNMLCSAVGAGISDDWKHRWFRVMAEVGVHITEAPAGGLLIVRRHR